MKSKDVAFDNRMIIRHSVVHAYNVTIDDFFSQFEPELLDWSLVTRLDIYHTRF